MDKGQVVMIFEDPMTKLKPEGKAKLIEKIREDELFEYWTVEFVGSDSPYDRKILK